MVNPRVSPANLLAAFALAAFAACESGSGTTPDAGTDARTDGGPTAPDATILDGRVGDAATSGSDTASAPGVDGGSFSSAPRGPTPPERSAVKIRVVNLFSNASGPGPAVDVYRTGELHARQREALPIVAALAYGKVSPFFSPVDSLVLPGDLGNTVIFFDAGTRAMNAGSYGGFLLRENLRDGDRVTIFMFPGRPMLGTTPASWGVGFEERPSAPGSAPAAVAGKAVIVARDNAVNGYGSAYRFHLGMGGVCQQDLSGSNSPGLFGSGENFAFAPGPLSLAAHRLKDPADCTRPEAGPVDLTVTSDSRTWLWIYGPSVTDFRLLALPFGP